MTGRKETRQLVKKLKGLIETQGLKKDNESGMIYYTSYGENIYDWELYFDGIALAYVRLEEYAINGIRIFLSHQREDGFIRRHVPLAPASNQEVPQVLKGLEAVGKAWEELEKVEHCKPFLCQIGRAHV